jgi:hypothetical protein
LNGVHQRRAVGREADVTEQRRAELSEDGEERARAVAS